MWDTPLGRILKDRLMKVNYGINEYQKLISHIKIAKASDSMQDVDGLAPGFPIIVIVTPYRTACG